MLETARLASLDLLLKQSNLLVKGGLLPEPNPALHVADLGWAIRATGRAGQSVLGNLMGQQIKLGLGLGLLNVLTYVDGSYTLSGSYGPHHGFQAFRSMYLAIWYALGAGLEGVAAASRVVNAWYNPILEGEVIPSAVTSELSSIDPGWKGFIANVVTGKGIWPKLIKIHSVIFGSWNGISGFYSLLNGKWVRGGALEIAAAGNFISKYPGLIGLTGEAAEFANPIGLAAGAAAAVALWVMNERDKAAAAHETEPYNKDFLQVAGNVLNPGKDFQKISNLLAQNSDEGVSPGLVFQALSKHFGIDPKKWIPWLIEQNDKDPNWLHLFVQQINNVNLGSAPQILGKNVGLDDALVGNTQYVRLPLDAIPRGTHDLRKYIALTLEGLRQWAEESGHPFPDKVSARAARNPRG